VKRIAWAALLALAACHGHQGPGVTLDADEDARNATGTKIDADLAAADAAARRPLPAVRPAEASAARGEPEDRTPDPAEEEADDNGD
jgi:hypothetical protein